MKDMEFSRLIRLLAVPLATVVLGLVLLFSPDTAAALFCKLLGWFLLLTALADGYSVWSGKKKHLVRALLLGIIGLWLLRNPLGLAKSIVRILGLTFFSWGAGNIRRNYRDRVTPGILVAGAVAVLGGILVLVPMEATRLVLNVAGIVIIGIGVADGYDRIHGRK